MPKTVLYGYDFTEYSQQSPEGKFPLPQFTSEEIQSQGIVWPKARQAVNDAAGVSTKSVSDIHSSFSKLYSLHYRINTHTYIF